MEHSRGVVRQVPLVAQLVAQFRQRIVEGTWPVDDRIPGELQLAAEFAVSRGTVREALRALSLTGVLEPRVGDGTYVRARDELSALLVQDPAAADLDHALDVRAIFESAAASRSATHPSAARIDAMREHLGRRTSAASAGDVESYIAADVAFHRELVESAENPLLTRLYELVGFRMRDSIIRTVHLPEPAVLSQQHEDVVQAIAAGDAARAASCATELIGHVRTMRSE